MSARLGRSVVFVAAGYGCDRGGRIRAAERGQAVECFVSLRAQTNPLTGRGTVSSKRVLVCLDSVPNLHRRRIREARLVHEVGVIAAVVTLHQRLRALEADRWVEGVDDVKVGRANRAK
jgi:hypothetical protein